MEASKLKRIRLAQTRRQEDELSDELSAKGFQCITHGVMHWPHINDRKVAETLADFGRNQGSVRVLHATYEQREYKDYDKRIGAYEQQERLVTKTVKEFWGDEFAQQVNEIITECSGTIMRTEDCIEEIVEIFREIQEDPSRKAVILGFLLTKKDAIAERGNRSTSQYNSLNVATGDVLDLMAANIGLCRHNGESDDNLRNRAAKQVHAINSLSKYDIDLELDLVSRLAQEEE
jgi:hypothetical protein